MKKRGRGRPPTPSAKKTKAKKPRKVIRWPRYAELSDSLLADQDDESPFTEVTDPKKRAYLVALSKTPLMGKACRLAGICDKTGYNYREDQSDTVFQRLLPIALKMGIGVAEDEGWRRAVDGWEEPVYQMGELVGTKLVKSDTMLIFMLKAAHPEKYRDRSSVTVDGSLALASNAAVDRLLAGITAAGGPTDPFSPDQSGSETE